MAKPINIKNYVNLFKSDPDFGFCMDSAVSFLLAGTTSDMKTIVGNLHTRAGHTDEHAHLHIKDCKDLIAYYMAINVKMECNALHCTKSEINSLVAEIQDYDLTAI